MDVLRHVNFTSVKRKEYLSAAIRGHYAKKRLYAEETFTNYLQRIIFQKLSSMLSLFENGLIMLYIYYLVIFLIDNSYCKER